MTVFLEKSVITLRVVWEKKFSGNDKFFELEREMITNMKILMFLVCMTLYLFDQGFEENEDRKNEQQYFKFTNRKTFMWKVKLGISD